MKVLVNWLPTSPQASAAVARTVEEQGFWGLGVTDSPRALELYTTIETCRSVTGRIAVGPCVTNPVTRHVSVHEAAMRAAEAAAPGRAFFGVGSGDSAVRGVGLRPAPPAEMVACVRAVREAAGTSLPAFVAAAGPKAVAAAGAVGGLLAGCGRDLAALRSLSAAAVAGSAVAPAAEPETVAGNAPLERWVSLRFAVAGEAAEVAALRQAFLPRALSAARFNLHPHAGVPEELVPVLAERFAAYDYVHHGTTGTNPNAGLFADRPDIEQWALDRYALIGDVDQCAAGLRDLAEAGVTGVFLSVRFEDPITHITRAGQALRRAGLAIRTRKELAS